jgi:hypothetical protein
MRNETYKQIVSTSGINSPVNRHTKSGANEKRVKCVKFRDESFEYTNYQPMPINRVKRKENGKIGGFAEISCRPMLKSAAKIKISQISKHCHI